MPCSLPAFMLALFQATRSRRIRRCLAHQAVEGSEDAVAPGRDRIVVGEQWGRADATGPLQIAEYDVVGIKRRRAAHERLMSQRRAHRFERLAQCRKIALAVGDDLLQLLAEALLP